MQVKDIIKDMHNAIYLFEQEEVDSGVLLEIIKDCIKKVLEQRC